MIEPSGGSAEAGYQGRGLAQSPDAADDCSVAAGPCLILMTPEANSTVYLRQGDSGWFRLGKKARYSGERLFPQPLRVPPPSICSLLAFGSRWSRLGRKVGGMRDTQGSGFPTAAPRSAPSDLQPAGVRLTVVPIREENRGDALSLSRSTLCGLQSAGVRAGQTASVYAASILLSSSHVYLLLIA
ncbi:hypothetical protein NDU88_002413 [Pleurodeles waltl]|uniref:Uncharacterized protein n=1 Tax=Pleurodeles waltl TaxID=8319 RepID=A0AAV7U9W0_PLEWA|nr:hypothetical protein NDU88_002413 [Pleurodeles waltl]